MSKQRKSNRLFASDNPALEHAADLVEEYTRKLRAMSRRIHDIRAKYLAEVQQRRKNSQQGPTNPVTRSAQEQQLWLEEVQGFQARHDECAEYLRGLIPQAVKLAQHVSQLITHGTNQSIIQIELSLRVAELESAIRTAQTLANSPLVFLGLD
jgi:hypothetical protein